MNYSCCDDRRRAVVRDHSTLNGIDYLEVLDLAAPTDAERQRTLFVHMLKPIGGARCRCSSQLPSRPAGS